MNAMRAVSLLLLLIAAVAGVGAVVQHAETRALRAELALLRGDQQALENARAENARLKAAQPSPAELARLRADHAAAERLRAELNTLRDSIRQAEAAMKGNEAVKE